VSELVSTKFKDVKNYIKLVGREGFGVTQTAFLGLAKSNKAIMNEDLSLAEPPLNSL